MLAPSVHTPLFWQGFGTQSFTSATTKMDTGPKSTQGAVIFYIKGKMGKPQISLQHSFIPHG